MFDFIPIKYYLHFFFHLLLFINLFTVLHNYLLRINDNANLNYMRVMGWILYIFTLLYMGFRPISYVFVDMVTYAEHYNRYMMGFDVVATHDVTFHYFMKFCSNFLSPTYFFFLCIIIYVTPLFIISRKMFKEYWFYAFLLFIGSFSFWAYGVNGIRNGVATSVFLLAIAYKDNKFLLFIFILISCLFHKTMLLPTFAYILTLFINNPKLFLKFWIACIPLSLVLGGLWISLFSSLGFNDERLSGYLAGGQGAGFRWDFLIYSGAAVFVGWYFIFKRGFNDKFYFQLFNMYLLSNGFWILVIRANFSNRFAYLSWFMMALIVIYPYLKQRFYINQNVVIGKVILAYFGFTYAMFLIYNL